MDSPPVKTEVFFDIPFSPEAVWPVLSKTDWLNRSAGLPPVDYQVASLPEGGTKIIASAKLFGLQSQWEEKPFEWREAEFYRMERIFQKGPFERIVGGMEFQAKERETTRLRIFSECYPRNAFGRAVAKFALGPKATGGMHSVVEHVTEFLRGGTKACLPKLRRTDLNEGAMTAAMQRLRAMAGESQANLISQLETYIRDSADVELAHIRPFAIARTWQQDKWAVLRLFLLGTRAGLLDLSWEVLCPFCRATRQPVTHALADVTPTAHCEGCQIQFDAEFDKSVELKFTVNSGIKTCEEKTFCLAGPGAKPHVLAQVIIPPRSSRDFKLPADRAGLRIRSPQVNNVLRFDLLDSARTLICSKEKFLLEESDPNRDGTLEIKNPGDYAITVLCERTEWSEDILTAARATNLQEFRDLFSSQVISPSEQIVVGQQIILFTDLRGSTAMYCGIGDAPAYAIVRDHFGVLRDAIREYHGAIVKTIGDAIMAVFSDTTDALNAVRKMHLGLTGISAHPDRPPLQLKSSLHLGPCLAVNANERLDYFGTTVNLAARLVDYCAGGDLTISDDFYHRAQTQTFLRKHNLHAEPSEMRFRGFDSPTKLWRIAFLTTDH